MKTAFGFEPLKEDRDLHTIYLAGYNINKGVWKTCRKSCIEYVALLVCENPEKHPEFIIDWAMEKLE